MLTASATRFEIGLDFVFDSIIAVAYFSIPLQIVYYLRQYPAALPQRYITLIRFFSLWIIFCGLTFAFNSMHFSVAVVLCTKFMTAIFSLVGVGILVVFIPGALQFLGFTKTLEDEILYEPEPSVGLEVKSYLDRRRSSVTAGWVSAIHGDSLQDNTK